jgi:nicotinate-nucleotide pyrophosphorylase (carboxylating)
MRHPELAEIENILRLSLEEDIGSGDVTSRSLFTMDDRAEARIISREEGIIAGTEVLKQLYSLLDSRVSVRVIIEDGKPVTKGNPVASLEGPVISILEGERTSLNFMQRMCGIATAAFRAQSLLQGTDIKVLDTRKTAPGLRLLDKYSVSAGGGTNHRIGLHDMVMIKENHVEAAGGIASALSIIRKQYGDQYTVEVEIQFPEQAKDAIENGADILLLDNMTRPSIEKTLDIVKGRAKIELSGNMTEERIRKLADLPVDFISMGSLTHSVQAFDLSLLIG